MSHLRHRWRFSDSALRHFCSRVLILTLSFDSQTIFSYLRGLSKNCVILDHVKMMMVMMMTILSTTIHVLDVCCIIVFYFIDFIFDSASGRTIKID